MITGNIYIYNFLEKTYRDDILKASVKFLNLSLLNFNSGADLTRYNCLFIVVKETLFKTALANKS